jgi:hypothetical protein
MGKEETEELIKIFVASIKTAEKESLFDIGCLFFIRF